MRRRAKISRLLAAVLILCIVPLPSGAVEAHSHTWRTDWAVDSRSHWHGCADPACRTLVPAWADGYAGHSYDNIHDPDCNICGWIRAVDPGHTHTWTEGWNSDGTHHWRRCGDPDCPGVVPGWAEGYGLHTYSGAGDTDCGICGRERRPDPDHVHSWTEEWDSDNICHWRRCEDRDCPGVVPSQARDYAVHSYDGGEDADCNICGRVRFVDPSHTHVWSGEWSGNENHHWYRCGAANCPGVAPSQAKGYAAHVYDGAGDTDCNICGRTRVAFSDSSGLLPEPEAPDPDVVVTGLGRVYVRPAAPQAGIKVIVTLTPGEHHGAGTLTVTGYSGQAVPAASDGNGTWSFTQPKEPVRLRAVFPPAYRVCDEDSSCPLASFQDLTPGGWYHDGVHYCLDWALMSGYDQTSFAPGDGLSGGMMAQTLYNLAGRPELPGESVYTGSGAWYSGAVAWAVGAGVMNLEDGYWKFSPEEDVTREQLAVMLWRYGGCPSVSGGTTPFPDAGVISHWAVDAVSWAADRGILQGREDGRLDPGGRVTRAEAASMLVRFLERSRQ